MFRRWMMKSISGVHLILLNIFARPPPSFSILIVFFSLQAVTSLDRRHWSLMLYCWTCTTPEMESQWPIRWCQSPAWGRPSLETLCATTTMAASWMAHFLIPGVCLYITLIILIIQSKMLLWCSCLMSVVPRVASWWQQFPVNWGYVL